MPTNYPTSIDSYTDKTDGIDTIMAADVNNLQSAVAAVETVLGVSPTSINDATAPAGSPSSVANYLDMVANIVKTITGAASWVSANAAAVMKSIFTAKGDIVAASAAGTPVRIAAGTNGQKLVANSAATPGVNWCDDDIGFSIIIGNGLDAITPGLKGHIEVPVKMNIEAVRLVTDVTGSIVIDIWKDTYAGFPPTNYNSITADTPPTVSSARTYEDTTLTSWTKALNKGDWLAFYVDSADTVKQVTLAISGVKTAVS